MIDRAAIPCASAAFGGFRVFGDRRGRRIPGRLVGSRSELARQFGQIRVGSLRLIRHCSSVFWTVGRRSRRVIRSRRLGPSGSDRAGAGGRGRRQIPDQSQKFARIRHPGCLAGREHRFQLRHPAVQVILALQNSIDHRRGDRQPRVPRQIQNRLHFVGHFAHRVQIQEPGHALDGVEAAENRMNRLGVGRILIERQQLQLDRGQMLSRLQNEIVQQLRIAGQRVA